MGCFVLRTDDQWRPETGYKSFSLAIFKLLYSWFDIWIRCTTIGKSPNCFRVHRGSILRSRQIRRITAGQRRCSLARCCSLSDYFDESFNWVFLKGLTQVAWTHCSVLQELWWGGRNHSQLKTYLIKIHYSVVWEGRMPAVLLGWELPPLWWTINAPAAAVV